MICFPYLFKRFLEIVLRLHLTAQWKNLLAFYQHKLKSSL